MTRRQSQQNNCADKESYLFFHLLNRLNVKKLFDIGKILVSIIPLPFLIGITYSLLDKTDSMG